MKSRLSALIAFLAIITFIFSHNSYSATITSNGSGKWHDATTWDSGVPTSSDDVIIAVGHTVTYNARHPSGDNNETVLSLTVNGTLTFPFAATADDADLDNNFTLRVTGTTTIAVGGAINTDNTYTTGADRTHQLNIEGTFSNAGTVDLTETDNRRVDVDFQTNTFSVTGAGTYSLYNVDVDNNGVVTFTADDITVDNTIDVFASSTLINNGTDLIVGPDIVGAFELAGDNATFTLTSGNVDIGASMSTDNGNVFQVDGDNCILNVDGGTLDIGDLTTNGRGRFRIDNDALTDFTFDVDGGTVNIADYIDFQSATAVMSLNISAGTVNVGTGGLGDETNSEFLNGSLVIDGASAVLEIGENANIDIVPTIDNGATFSVGTNTSETANLDIDGAWVIAGASTFTADAGLDINATFSLTVQEGSIVNVESNNTSNTAVEFNVSGTLTVNDGTVNVAGGVVDAGSVTQDVIRVADGGVIDIQDGTINVLHNAGFTDGSRITGGNAVRFNGTTNGTLNVGNGIGSANSAVFNIAPNLASQPSPTEEIILRNLSDEGRWTVSSDGHLVVGGGNIGTVLLDDDADADTDFHLVVSGGTVDIYGSLDLDHGAGYQQTGGTVSVGTTANSGVNNIDFGTVADATAPTIFEVTGGTFSVGDGAMNMVIGNDNDTPAHGSATAYVEMEITGGTVNFNGRFRLRDNNARFIVGGGATINIDPQAVNNLDPDLDALWLDNGIVDIQGAVNINILNPHAVTGTGHAIEIQGIGATSDLITSSYSPGVGAAVDFSNVTWGFGDGSESNDGADGFDLDFATGHTSYGNFVINNPTGSNRQVVFTTSGNSYLTEDITITAGILDVGTNNLDDDGASSTFSIAANGTLQLDTDFPGTSAANYGTYTLSTGSTVDFSGSGTISDGQVPDGTAFSNLTHSGSGTATINAAVNVNGDITLADGTLAIGTNVTFAGSKISRSAGVLTGDIQGTANYEIEYTGLSKSIDDTSDPEWTGGGTFDLTVNLDAGQTLTLTGSQIAVDDLTVTQGTLTDASAGFTHTVAGNLTMNTSYTGSGTISITGGSATHTLSTSGTATFSNLTMNDASHDASGDLDLTITGTLTLTAGDIQVTSGTVTLNSGATISGGSSTSYVAFDGTNTAGGMIQTYTSSTDSKTYPIGTTTEYTPGSITLTAAAGFGELTMVPVASGSPFTLDGSNVLDLAFHWIVTTDGTFSGVTANHSYTYDQSDVQGVEGNYLAARYNVSSPEWFNSDDTASGTDGVNTTTNVATLTGVDYLEGHLTAGEIDEFSGVITTFYLRSDLSEPLDWNDDTNWTNTDGGTTPLNRTPGTNSPVVIKREVNVDDDGQTAGSITIDAAGTMTIGENGSSSPSSGHTFGTVSGTGVLQIVSDDTDNPTFPDENGGNWTSFLGASGGTVEYTGDGSYTLPSDVSTYYNLTITSTSAACSCTKTLGDVDLTIHNDFAVSGGNTTTAAISDATNGDLTISGAITIAATNTLSFGSTNARAVTVTGNVTNSGTLNVANSGSAAHTLSTGGSLSSAGTTDFNTGGSTVDMTFTGTGNETISGAGSVDFNRIIVNKGTSQSATLEATVTTLTITDTGSGASTTSIDLQNGTFIISTGGTFTANSNGDWTIPSTAKLDMNSGTPTVQMTTSSAGTLFLNGSIQVSSGIMNVGNQTDNVTDNSIRYDGTAGEIIVDGGILNVGGAIRPNVTDASAALAFTLSSGTVSLARNTSTNNINSNNNANRAEADFSLDNASSSFTMTGGTFEVVRAESTDGCAISIHSNVTTYTVTGGTVNVMRDAHDAFSSNSTNQGNDIGLYSNVPFWNLQVGDGDFEGDVGNANTSTALTLQILNDFTLNLDNTAANEGNFDMFRANSAPSDNSDAMDMTVGGSFTITDGTWEVTNDGSGGTITFNGSGLAGQTSPQVINSNGETLGDININNTSGSVQLGAALTISGDWTYTTGTFNQSSNLITMTTPGTAAGTTINGSPSFDDITLSNTSDITLSGGDMTIASGGTLTISDDVILDIGDNGLILSDQTAGTVTFSATADNTNMIRVSGNELAQGVTRTYPDASTTNFIFPIGATVSSTDYYMPAQIDLTAGGGAGSTATVVLVTAQHPQVTDSENALNVYWKVTETGFDDTQTADHTYTYGTDVADIVEGADDTNFLDAFNVGSPTFAWNEGSTANVTEFDLGSGGIIAISDPGTDNIVGEFTAGVDAAFNSITVFYTIRDGDWDNTSASTTPWTNDACGGAQTEVTGVQPGSTNPVIICSTETVTITTTTGLNASAVEVNGQITSQVADITTIGNIDGTGTILFSHTSATTPSFGTLSGGFVGASGGTINYGGTAAYTLPTNTTYNDLIISNSNTITLGANVTVNGDATFNGNGTVDMGGFTLSDADNGGTFTLSGTTTMDVDAANNFPDNFNTYTLSSTSTVDYSLDNSSVQTVLGGITYGNLTLSRPTGNPAQKSLTTDVTIAGNLDIGLRTELLSNNHTITLQGDWTRHTSGNTNFDEGTGTVILTGSANQTIDTNGGSEVETFYNLTINKSGGSTVDFGSNVTSITVTNDLVVTAETLAMGTTPLTVDGNFSTGASGTFTSSTAPDFNGNLTNAGTFTVPTTINLNGNFNNTGTFTNASSTLVFDNTSTAQSISGNATTYNNITVAKASGVDLTLSAATTVNGILALQNEGNVILSSGNLTIPVGGSITGDGGGSTVSDFSATRMIRTDGGGSDPFLVKNADTDADWDFVFPVGVDDSGNKYTPVTVDATTDNITAGTLSIRSIDGTTTDQSISGSATTLNRHFDVDITGLTGAVTFDFLFQYDDADVQGTEGDYLSAYSERGIDDGWNQPVASMSNTNAGTNQFGASATLDGTISFSSDIDTEWIPGDTDLIFPHFYTRAGGGVDCGAVTCDWNDGTNWTLTDGGTTSAGATPGSDNLVTISSGHTMAMDNNTNTASALEVIGTLDIAATTGHTLGDLTGTGTVQIESNALDTYVNTGSGSTFFDNGGGTVQYGGNSAYTLPSAITEYHNLTITGGTQDTHDKTLGVNTLVHNDLTANTVDIENPTDYSVEVRGSFSSVSGGRLQLDDGTFIWANSTTESLSSNIVFGTAGSLTLDNFGEKDLAGTLNVANITINSNSGTFDANTNNINLTGNWDNKSSSNKLSNPGTMTFNGGGAQSIDGDNTFGTTNISTASTAVTVNTGTQTFTGVVTLAGSTSLDIGSNTIRVGNTFDVDAGTFTGTSGTIVYTSTTDPETQTDAITVLTLELDKGGSTNTFDNDPATVTFTNLVVTNGEYDGPDLDINGNFTIGANGTLDLTSITTMDINGDFSNAATLNLSGISTMTIDGDFSDTGTFTAPTSIDMDGAGAQQINNALSVTNFTKSGGGDLTLNDDLTISGTLTLTSGDIISTTTNILTMTDGATASLIPSGSASSHVVGAMAHTAASTSLRTRGFPLGDGTNYRPVELDLTQASATSRVYTAVLNAGAATPRTMASGIHHVTNVRHYNITQSPTEALTSGVVRITYGSDDLVLSTSTLRIVKDDGGTNWLNLGGNVSGSPTAGTIESTNNFTSFSDFGLGSSDNENSLPVSLVSFDADYVGTKVLLVWSTASELNNDYFEIQRSGDGVNFFAIGTEQGSGTTNESNDYNFIDQIPLMGICYYRLKQVDFDGKFEYSNIVSVNDGLNPDHLNVQIIPNPSRSRTLELRFSSINTENNLEFQISDYTGRIIKHIMIDATEIGGTYPLTLSPSLASGIYILKIKQGNRVGQSKLILD